MSVHRTGWLSNPDCLLFPASTVKRFLQVGTFFVFFYSSFTWCTWEAEHLITAGLGYTDTAVVQEATCSHFRGAKQTILSLLRAEASHILEASGQEFVGYFYPCYQWDRKRCTKLFSINQ